MKHGRASPMAIYTLAGQGLQTLTSRTNFLFIDILTLGPGYSTGLAIPTNYFHLGLFRLGTQGYFSRVIPLDGFRMSIGPFEFIDQLGYYLKEGTSVQVAEGQL